jgi:cobalt-zinc-cadmium efflux system outer membrane protein
VLLIAQVCVYPALGEERAATSRPYGNDAVPQAPGHQTTRSGNAGILPAPGDETTVADTTTGATTPTGAPAPAAEPAADQPNLPGPLPAAVKADSVNLPRRKFTLGATFNKADTENKEILVAAATLPINQANIIIARAIPNPNFSMTYGFGPAWRIIAAGNNQQVGWTEEVQVAGRRTKKETVARANYLEAAFNLEAVRFDVHNRVRRAYTELAAAAAYAELVEAQQSIAQNLLDIAQKRFTAGKAAGSEVIQARLIVMQYETQHNQAVGRLVQDSAQLSQLLGEMPQHQEIIDPDKNALFYTTNKGEQLVPPPSAGVPPLDQLVPTAWRQRTDLKAAIQQAWVDRKSLSLARTQRIPDPFIGFNFLYSTYKSNQPKFFDPQFGTVPFQPGYMLTVQEELPIWYQYQGQTDQAKATWQSQMKQNDVQYTAIAASIVAAYEALQLTQRNIDKFQRDLLPDAEHVAHLARRGYELGVSDLATAVLAQQQYQQLRSQYFDAVVSYQNAWADLEKAIGVPMK